jgi:hypothetical protein
MEMTILAEGSSPRWEQAWQVEEMTMVVEMRSREAMAMFEGDHNVTGLSRRSGLRWGVAAGLRAVLHPL